MTDLESEHFPGVVVSGRFDFQAPIGWDGDLSRAWPRSKLVVVNDADHALAAKGVIRELVRALGKFAHL